MSDPLTFAQCAVVAAAFGTFGGIFSVIGIAAIYGGEEEECERCRNRRIEDAAQTTLFVVRPPDRREGH